MEEIKIGADVLVKGKVSEVRETAKGKVFKVEIKNKIYYSSECLADERNILNGVCINH